MLWTAQPSLQDLLLHSQDSNQTNFSAAARCDLLRSLRTGVMVLDTINRYIDNTLYNLTSMSLEIPILKESEMPSFQNQKQLLTPSLLILSSD